MFVRVTVQNLLGHLATDHHISRLHAHHIRSEDRAEEHEKTISENSVDISHTDIAGD